MCTALLIAGAHIDARNHAGETALFVAVEAGRTDVVRCLLSRSADVSVVEKSTGLTALQKAVTFGREDVVACLLNKSEEQVGVYGGGEGDCESYAPLREATSAGFLDAVRRMMDVGINPFELNQEGAEMGNCSAAAVAVISCWRNGGTGFAESDSEEEEEMEEEEECEDWGVRFVGDTNGRKRTGKESWEGVRQFESRAIREEQCQLQQRKKRKVEPEDIGWDTRNKRLRLLMPVSISAQNRGVE